MKKIFLQFLAFLHGFLILSSLYCALFCAIIPGKFQSYFQESLFFVPALFICFFASKYLKWVWQYLLVAVSILGFGWFLGHNILTKIGLCIWGVSIVTAYFMARVKQEKCWLDKPMFGWLLTFLGVYFIAYYRKDASLHELSLIGAGLYFLIINIYTNMTQMDLFIKINSRLERLPIKRLQRINQIMVWTFTGICAIGIFLSPYLGLEKFFWGILKGIQRIITEIVSMIHVGPSSYVEQKAEHVSSSIKGEFFQAGETSMLMKIVSNIIEIVLLILLIGILVYFLRYAFFKCMEWARKFHEKADENGDQIESLRFKQKSQREHTKIERKKEILFWNQSAQARIRKYYRHRILRERKEPPKSFWTPTKIEETLEMSANDKKRFHELYEKARYSNMECTKDEWKEMQKLK